MGFFRPGSACRKEGTIIFDPCPRVVEVRILYLSLAEWLFWFFLAFTISCRKKESASWIGRMCPQLVKSPIGGGYPRRT